MRGIKFMRHLVYSRAASHKPKRVKVRKNSFFSKTSITVVLVTNRGRELRASVRLFSPSRALGVEKKEAKEFSRGIMSADIHKPHNRAQMYLFAKYSAYFYILLSLSLSLLFFRERRNFKTLHVKGQSRKKIQMKEIKK